MTGRITGCFLMSSILVTRSMRMTRPSGRAAQRGQNVNRRAASAGVPLAPAPGRRTRGQRLPRAAGHGSLPPHDGGVSTDVRSGDVVPLPFLVLSEKVRLVLGEAQHGDRCTESFSDGHQACACLGRDVRRFGDRDAARSESGGDPTVTLVENSRINRVGGGVHRLALVEPRTDFVTGDNGFRVETPLGDQFTDERGLARGRRSDEYDEPCGDHRRLGARGV